MPGFLDNSLNSDGQIYSLPFYRSTPILYYNLDFFKNNSGLTRLLQKSFRTFIFISLKKLLVNKERVSQHEEASLLGIF